MFGLEKNKKKKHEEFVFEFEKECQNPVKSRAIKQKVEERIQKIKASLHSGTEQDEFDQLGVLLHGYTSLIKVMSRFEKKK